VCQVAAQRQNTTFTVHSGVLPLGSYLTYPRLRRARSPHA
jgi:hypothetical protein